MVWVAQRFDTDLTELAEIGLGCCAMVVGWSGMVGVAQRFDRDLTELAEIGLQA